MCHTRTEQQFHPDIYKSTKCHDMQQTTYCPRGPFCAFAHVEQHDNDQPEGSIRNRAGTADACFKMARYIGVENIVQRFFDDILFSRTNSNGTYRHEK